MLKRSKRVEKIRSMGKGQSLVEVAIFLPILLMMLTGVVEFGFLLNQYINLIDGPREGARFATDLAPYTASGAGTADVPEFYTAVANITRDSINPYQLDLSLDDIVISVFSVKDGNVIARFPRDAAVDAHSKVGEWHLTGKHDSKFTDAMIQARLDATAPNTGLVLVELFYNYHQVLNLPWLTVWVPDPILLSSYSIAPIPAAEPK